MPESGCQYVWHPRDDTLGESHPRTIPLENLQLHHEPKSNVKRILVKSLLVKIQISIILRVVNGKAHSYIDVCSSFVNLGMLGPRMEQLC